MSAGAASRERLDRILVMRGLVSTRSQAQALILAGRVSSEGRRLEKPGVRYPADIALEIREGRRFVSRGGHKLAAALESFALDVGARNALDVGASTGGFTQVLLEAGAARVIALDVGRGQLDWSLRQDPRVHPLEGVNARYLAVQDLPFLPYLAVVDVSFISLRLVLPPVATCIENDGSIVALVKPQFEVGRGQVGKGGIVRDPALHREVLEGIVAFAVERDWGVAGLIPSPIEGAEGNREFLVHLRPAGQGFAAAELRPLVEVALRQREESAR
jgi:23S rRNA (cytidine1920-2'-O)/16S rRNA (cytidine1409-2'-O)-methyltransferase